MRIRDKNWLLTPWRGAHCPKFLKLSRDILRSEDATKWNGEELLGLFFRITFWTDLWFLNELQNILRISSQGFLQAQNVYLIGNEPMTVYTGRPHTTH